jgi:hypothetical protein
MISNKNVTFLIFISITTKQSCFNTDAKTLDYFFNPDTSASHSIDQHVNTACNETREKTSKRKSSMLKCWASVQRWPRSWICGYFDISLGLYLSVYRSVGQIAKCYLFTLTQINSFQEKFMSALGILSRQKTQRSLSKTTLSVFFTRITPSTYFNAW